MELNPDNIRSNENGLTDDDRDYTQVILHDMNSRRGLRNSSVPLEPRPKPTGAMTRRKPKKRSVETPRFGTGKIRSSITADQALQIVKLLDAGEISRRDIAEKAGCSRNAVDGVARRSTNRAVEAWGKLSAEKSK